MSLILREISICTTNNVWEPGFVVNDELNFKVLSIKDIAFVINTGKYSNNKADIDLKTYIERANNEVYIYIYIL